MATLSQKSSRGGMKWDQVKDQIDSITFEIEKGFRNTPLMNSVGQEIDIVHQKERIKILSQETKKIGRYLAVFVRSIRGVEGWLHLNKIRNPGPSSTTKHEDLAYGVIKTSISKAIDENFGNGITVTLDGMKAFNDVVDIRQPPGTPKADFTLVDSKGKDVAFISHKAAGGAKAFQQYGGISSAKNSGIMQHACKSIIMEIDSFIDAVDEYVSENGPICGRVYRKVISEDLVRHSIFGYESNYNFSSLNSVDVIGQGDPVFQKLDLGTYDLSFSDQTHHNPDVSWALQGDFEAIFVARRAVGRPLQGLRSEVKVENTRGGIFPIRYLTGEPIAL